MFCLWEVDWLLATEEFGKVVQETYTKFLQTNYPDTVKTEDDLPYSFSVKNRIPKIARNFRSLLKLLLFLDWRDKLYNGHA